MIVVTVLKCTGCFGIFFVLKSAAFLDHHHFPVVYGQKKGNHISHSTNEYLLLIPLISTPPMTQYSSQYSVPLLSTHLSSQYSSMTQYASLISVFFYTLSNTGYSSHPLLLTHPITQHSSNYSALTTHPNSTLPRSWYSSHNLVTIPLFTSPTNWFSSPTTVIIQLFSTHPTLSTHPPSH